MSEDQFNSIMGAIGELKADIATIDSLVTNSMRTTALQHEQLYKHMEAIEGRVERLENLLKKSNGHDRV